MHKVFPSHLRLHWQRVELRLMAIEKTTWEMLHNVPQQLHVYCSLLAKQIKVAEAAEENIAQQKRTVVGREYTRYQCVIVRLRTDSCVCIHENFANMTLPLYRVYTDSVYIRYQM